MKHWMSSRGFCGFGNAVLPNAGVICRAAFVTWAGRGGCWLCPALCRKGLLSRELRSRAKQCLCQVGAHPASLEAETLALVPGLPGQYWPLFWAPCAPAVLPPLPQQLCAGGKCVQNARMPAEQLLLAFPACPSWLSQHFSLHFSAVFS